MPRPVAATAHGHSSLRARGGFDATAATETHHTLTHIATAMLLSCAPPPDRTALDSPTNDAEVSALAASAATAAARRAAAGAALLWWAITIHVQKHSNDCCMCHFVLMHACLPGKAPSWKGSRCFCANYHAVLERQHAWKCPPGRAMLSCKSCTCAPRHFLVLRTTVLFAQSAPPPWGSMTRTFLGEGFQDP